MERRHTAIDSATSTCPNYLDEFTFRFNRRNSGAQGLFYRLGEQGLETAPDP
jgi:hypothetical protein